LSDAWHWASSHSTLHACCILHVCRSAQENKEESDKWSEEEAIFAAIDAFITHQEIAKVSSVITAHADDINSINAQSGLTALHFAADRGLVQVKKTTGVAYSWSCRASYSSLLHAML
jgi:hypothetical protein